MFRNILVPLASQAKNEAAVCHGAALAGAFGARLNILQIIEAEVPEVAAVRGLSASSGPSLVSSGWFAQRSRLRSERAQMAHCLRRSPAPVNFLTLEGEFRTAVMEALYRWGGDLVVLNHAMLGNRDVGISETGLYRSLNRRVSTMLVYRDSSYSYDRLPETRYKKILVPLDFSPRTESALAYAVKIAQQHQARLILAHIVAETPGEQGVPPVAERTEVAVQYLEGLQGRLSPESDIRLFSGVSVAHSLSVLAEAENADLVVLSARGYFSGAPGLQRSVSQYFYDFSRTPVLRIMNWRTDSLK